MQDLQNAGSGLKKMFIASVGAVVCTVLLIIPIVNILAMFGALIFSIISLVGLNEAGKDIEGCKTAFLLTIVNVVINILKNIFGSGFLGVLLAIAGYIVGFLIVYFVCKSVADVLEQSDPDVAKTGHMVWKINLVCYAAALVIAVLALIPVLNILAAAASIIIAIVALVASILYMIFLYKSSNALA